MYLVRNAKASAYVFCNGVWFGRIYCPLFDKLNFVASRSCEITIIQKVIRFFCKCQGRPNCVIIHPFSKKSDINWILSSKGGVF